MSYYTRQQNRRRSEATEQETLIQWCGWQQSKYPELKLIYHIPNGGSRNTLEAANLKRQGVKAGVPDLCLPVARNGFHGLYIEMKYGKNKTTENQKEWLEELTAQGYFTAVCYGAEEAERIIARYLQFPGYPALKQNAGVVRAAKKLFEYEETGLAPYEVRALIERERALTEKVKKMQDW